MWQKAHLQQKKLPILLCKPAPIWKDSPLTSLSTLSLTQLIQSSVLLRPWSRIATLSASTLQNWFQQSLLLRPVFKVLKAFGNKRPAFPWLLQTIHLFLLLGIIGLFSAFTFAGTQLTGFITFGLCSVALFSGLIFRPAILSRFTSIDLLVSGFFLSAGLSTAFSSFWQTSLVGLAKMLTFFAGYLVFRVVTERGLSTIITLSALLALIGIGESLIGFYQFVNHVQPLATWSDPTVNSELVMSRIFGTLQPLNPNLLAGFLTPCAATSLGMFWITLNSRRKIIPLALLATTLSIFVAIVLTGSRGGFLAIGAMALCAFAYWGHLVWHSPQLKSFQWAKTAWVIMLASGLIIVAGSFAGSEKLRARALSMFAMREDSSISYRLNVYHSAMAMASDNPVLGIGPGNDTFKQVYGLYMVPGYNALGSYSVPLEIAVEQGLVGLVIFASLLLVLVLRVIFTLDAASVSLSHQYLMGALLTGIVGSVAYGVFDTIWYRPAVNLVFWFMVAALAKLTELNTRQDFQNSTKSATKG
jgi:putative inorganic carbon (hco3(-)) transporter